MATPERKPTSHELRGVVGAAAVRVPVVGAVAKGVEEERAEGDRMAISHPGIAHLAVVRGIDPQDKGLEEDRRRGHVVPGVEGEAGRVARAIVVRCGQEKEVTKIPASRLR